MLTKEEILSELERLQPWFHRIDLGGGVYTKTESVMGEPVDHPAGPWGTIGKCLPQDLSGKTVLDVGCNAGFYAVEAKRRGARRVLGVDGQRQHVRHHHVAALALEAGPRACRPGEELSFALRVE